MLKYIFISLLGFLLSAQAQPHVAKLYNYPVDINNAKIMVDKCYKNHREQLRQEFEESAKLLVALLDLDDKYKKQYIGFSRRTGDILTMVDRYCSSLPEYDRFLSETTKVVKLLTHDDYSAFIDILSEYLVTEFGNLSEKIDGKF